MTYLLQQYLPFTVLKPWMPIVYIFAVHVATVPTVYGIETFYLMLSIIFPILFVLQQYPPFTVCTEGCETAEEQSDDEVRTSQVPERSEGKTKVMRQ